MIARLFLVLETYVAFWADHNYDDPAVLVLDVYFRAAVRADHRAWQLKRQVT